MNSVRNLEVWAKDLKSKASRLSFGEELAQLGASEKSIVVLDADLSKSTRTDLFAEKFPDRFFNMGIAEANMIGVAAGLAGSGKIPFAASFGCFLTGRYDQIRMSVAASLAKVRLVGTHAGVGIGEDGHSQMALEDLTLMRTLPGMIVFQPGDDLDTRSFMRWSLGFEGPCYMRLTRQNLRAYNRSSDYKFSIGVWDELIALNPGTKVTIIGSGGLLECAVGAAELLKSEHGLEVSVANGSWIKPIDEAFLSRVLEVAPRLIVSLEDHYSVGGLGGAVAEFLASRGAGVPLLRIGVEGLGQSGKPEANYEHYGFTPKLVAARVKSVLV